MRYNPGRDCREYYEWPNLWDVKPWYLEKQRKKRPKPPPQWEFNYEVIKQSTVPIWSIEKLELYEQETLKKRTRDQWKKNYDIKFVPVEPPPPKPKAPSSPFGSAPKEPEGKPPPKILPPLPKPPIEPPIKEKELQFAEWKWNRKFPPRRSALPIGTRHGNQMIKVTQGYPYGALYVKKPLNIKEVRDINYTMEASRQKAVAKQKADALELKRLRKMKPEKKKK